MSISIPIKLLEGCFAKEISETIKLTSREVDIAACLLNGRATKGIAHLLSISPRTVETHVQSLMGKFEVGSRDILISAIQQSSQGTRIRSHYNVLLNLSSLEASLKSLSSIQHAGIKKRLRLVCHNQDIRDILGFYLAKHLGTVGIKDKIVKTENGLQIDADDSRNIETLDVELSDSYDDILFKVLSLYFSSNFVKACYQDFRKKCTESVSVKNNVASSQSQIPFSGKLRMSYVLFFLVIMSMTVASIYNLSSKETFCVRSTLTVPAQDSMLQRKDILKNIEGILSSQDGIQTVVLTGIGGAGKTTLARQYARHQNATVIWEINAETRDGMVRSFEDLADGLCQSKTEKDTFREILETKDVEKREQKMLFLITELLRRHSNWVLIFDNIEKLNDVRPFLPEDEQLWGKGKVVITTRKPSKHRNPEHIIRLNELTEKQKLDLFLGIIKDRKQDVSQESLMTLLKALPPYPLDVATAAHYILETGISYKEYLTRMEALSKEFDLAQKDLQQEISAYDKTRYGIVAASFRELLDKDEAFKAILLSICLLDSQNISLEILRRVGSKSHLEEHLKVLTDASILSRGSKSSNYYIHRSLQRIGLTYLKVRYGDQGTRKSVERLTQNIARYTKDLSNKEDAPKLKTLQRNLVRILSFKDLLSMDAELNILLALGGVYHHLTYYKKSRNILKKALPLIPRNKGSDERLARALLYLGINERELGYQDQAIQNLKESLEYYNRSDLATSLDRAQALTYLGISIADFGFVNNADEFKEALKFLGEGLNIYRQHGKQYIGIALPLSNIGKILGSLGRYEEAIACFHESLLILYANHENHLGTARTLKFLGSVYQQSGQFQKAKDVLEKSLLVYEKHISKDHSGIGWTSNILGQVYLDLGDNQKALQVLESSIENLRKNFPHNHFSIAWAQARIGFVLIELGQYEKAKDLILKWLPYLGDGVDKIFVLEKLGAAYEGLGQTNKAIQSYEEALSGFKKHYPEDSPHTRRIQNKLQSVSGT